MKKIIRFFGNYRLFSVAVVTLIIGLILYLAGEKNISKWLVSIVSILEVLPLLWNMYKDIKIGRYGVDILAATSITVAVILGEYWAAIVVVIMLTGGQALEDYASRQAQTELKGLLAKAPLTANLLFKGKLQKVPVGTIKKGDKLLVKPGEVVPVDGIIIDGGGNFNESSITGESLPEEKTVNDVVLSGTLSVDGAVTIKASASAEDSQYQQIIKLVRSASNSQAPFVRLADRYSLPFTIVAFAIGIAVWVISSNAIRFLEVIIVATPCPLILAAPVAFIGGMARASKYGIIVKTGKSLERLAESRVIAFDKTGTLTTGELTVNEIKAFNGYGDNDVLKIALSLEAKSNHVLAEALINEAKKRSIKPIKVKSLEEDSGMGIKANLKGQPVLVGSQIFLQQHGIDLIPVSNYLRHTKTIAYVSLDNKVIGIITFNDELRSNAKSTIGILHKIGLKKIVIITGDNKATADNIANQLGIDEVYADALPSDKLKILSKLKPRPNIFVGDGVNDAPVLTSADVGIAMGAKGSTAASESADMVIMMDDIARVADGIEIAKKTFSIAKQSILIGIGLSLALMLIFATGKFPPFAGALLQEVIDVFVIFNALRAHAITPSMASK